MKLKFWQTKPAARAGFFQAPRILTEAEQNRANLERLLSLGGVSLGNPILKTVFSYADEHAANEQEAALRPDLPDSVRQYNAGRAASALDFATALRELHAQAQREKQKAEK